MAKWKKNEQVTMDSIVKKELDDLLVGIKDVNKRVHQMRELMYAFKNPAHSVEIADFKEYGVMPSSAVRTLQFNKLYRLSIYFAAAIKLGFISKKGSLVRDYFEGLHAIADEFPYLYLKIQDLIIEFRSCINI